MSTFDLFIFSVHGEPVEPFIVVFNEPVDKLRVSEFDFVCRD